MFFLIILLIIVIIYILVKPKKEGFEFNPEKINLPIKDKLKIYSSSDFNDTEKDKLMYTFGQDIYSSYKFLKLDKMKNNLWSYCFIYKNGGIYINKNKIEDVSVFDKDGLILIPELNDNLFDSEIFACSKPNNPILKNIIELSIQRILNNEVIREDMIEYITGNRCFTDGVKQYLSENNIPVYNNINDYVKYKTKDITVLGKLSLP